MSTYSSDKCSKNELLKFKNDVIIWLNTNFPKWQEKFKIKAFICYNGDIRLYDGTYQSFRNKKSSFRKTKTIKNKNGDITGYNGTRGNHTTSFANYITINKDEFSEIKKAWKEKENCENCEEWYFQNDLIFSKLI